MSFNLAEETFSWEQEIREDGNSYVVTIPIEFFKETLKPFNLIKHKKYWFKIKLRGKY